MSRETDHKKLPSLAELISLKDKRALITGSASGIGRAIAYRFAEAGVMVFTRALASEYGKHGFRINVLVPGGVLTPGTKSMAKEALRFKLGVVKSGIEYAMRTPLGRMGKPDEVARMALVLASDLAAYVQGTLIVVDGGFLSA